MLSNIIQRGQTYFSCCNRRTGNPDNRNRCCPSNAGVRTTAGQTKNNSDFVVLMLYKIYTLCFFFLSLLFVFALLTVFFSSDPMSLGFSRPIVRARLLSIIITINYNWSEYFFRTIIYYYLRCTGAFTREFPDARETDRLDGSSKRGLTLTTPRRRRDGRAPPLFDFRF